MRDAIAVDRYVIDTLMQDLIGHDRAPSAFIIYLYLWRHTIACDAPTVQQSLRQISDGTGLSKRGVQDALTTLSRRKLVSIARKGITDVPSYKVRHPWRGAS